MKKTNLNDVLGLESVNSLAMPRGAVPRITFLLIRPALLKPSQGQQRGLVMAMVRCSLSQKEQEKMDHLPMEFRIERHNLVILLLLLLRANSLNQHNMMLRYECRIMFG